MDAKVGLFIYPPHPTAEQYNAYLLRSGREPLKARYHMADKSWQVVDWNPEALAELAQAAGAKYIVFGVDPHSHFLAYPSQFADRDDSPFLSLRPDDPSKDYVAELAAAVRERGLRFGIYRNYLHPGRNKYFLETTYELIDRYQPDTLWLDGDKLSFSDDELRSRELAAYYYNNSRSPDGVALEDALGSYKRETWDKSLTHGDWFRKELSGPHADITDGYFVRYETLYRRRVRGPESSHGLVNNLVEWIADASAKNGNVELVMHLGPDELYRLEDRTLRQIGMWLEVNSEAIYGTRPWFEGAPGTTTADGVGVRYTTRDDAVYAIVFDWPTGQTVLPHVQLQPETHITLLGVAPELRWENTADGARITMPLDSDFDRDEGFSTEIPCDHAFALKITPKPLWQSSK